MFFQSSKSMNKIPKQILGFFSISIAWVISMIMMSIYQVIKHDRTDLQVIISWSAIFVFVAWGIFVIFPLARLDHSRKIFRIKFLPFVTGVYAMLVYSLLIDGLFRSVELVLNFLVWALIIGILFGLIYSILISSKRLILLLNRKPILKVFSPLSPLILSAFLWWLLPALLPSVVFRFMPEPIQNQIAAKTLPKFKKGDKFSTLEHSLPGYFYDAVQNGNGGLSLFGGSLFDFHLEVKNDTIQVFDFHLNQ